MVEIMTKAVKAVCNWMSKAELLKLLQGAHTPLGHTWNRGKFSVPFEGLSEGVFLWNE